MRELERERETLLAVIETLHLREDRYRRLVEDVRIIAWEFDFDRRCFTYVSPNAERILGYAAAQWHERLFWFNHLHPDDRNWVSIYTHERIARGEDHELEYRMIAADGSTVWLRDITTVQRAENDAISLHGMFIDITERKRMEHALMKVTAAVSPVVGDEFFRMLVLNLAEALDAPYVRVAVSEGLNTTSLAECLYGTCSTAGTMHCGDGPCSIVLGGTPHVLPERAAEVWPRHALRTGLATQSYAGVPLIGSEGDVIGILAIADTRPLRDAELVIHLMQILASRAAMELERMRSDAALRESQSRLQAISQNVPGVVYIYDSLADGSRELLYCGPGLEDAIGSHNAALVKADFSALFDLIHPDDRLALRQAVDHALANDSIVQLDIRLRDEAGRWFWVRNAGRPERRGTDAVRWHVLLLNVEEQVHAETTLRRAEEHLRLMHEQMPAVMWTVDAKLQFTSIAGSGFEPFNVAANEVVGRSLLADHAPDSIVITSHRRALAGESVRYEVNLAGTDYSCRLEPFCDHMEAIIGVIGIALDVTEQRRDQQRMKLMMRELDHRVRNNLATISAIAQQTADRADSMDSFMDAFMRRLNAMTVAHEMLASSQWQSIALDALMPQLLSPYFERSDRRVTIEGEPVQLSASVAFPLCLALNELATNAMRHGALTTMNGTLAVTWGQSSGDPPQLHLTWRERGVAASPRTTVDCKPGFGHSIVTGLVRHQLRGDIDIAFDHDGLTCTLRVPLAQEANALRDVGTPRAPSPPHGEVL